MVPFKKTAYLERVIALEKKTQHHFPCLVHLSKFIKDVVIHGFRIQDVSAAYAVEHGLFGQPPGEAISINFWMPKIVPVRPREQEFAGQKTDSQDQRPNGPLVAFFRIRDKLLKRKAREQRLDLLDARRIRVA